MLFFTAFIVMMMAVFNCKKVFIHIVDLLWICKQILKNTLFSHFFVLLFAHNEKSYYLCSVIIKQHELITHKTLEL